MKPVVKVYIHSEDGEKFFGLGPLLLLRHTKKTGSLRQAAIDMNMAYTKATKLIKTAEQNFGFKLIESKTGGKNGGGSTITKQAEVLIEQYEKMCSEIDDFANKKFLDFCEQST